MQSEEYYEYIKWAKKNDAQIKNLTGNNVKFIEYLLANNLGTHIFLFESVKLYQREKPRKQSKWWIVRFFLNKIINRKYK